MSDGKGNLGKVGGREGKTRVLRFAVDEEAVAMRERESKAFVALSCHRCAPVHACSDGCMSLQRYNMLQRV
jgi:hypothetical protein